MSRIMGSRITQRVLATQGLGVELAPLLRNDDAQTIHLTCYSKPWLFTASDETRILTFYGIGTTYAREAWIMQRLTELPGPPAARLVALRLEGVTL